MSAEQSLDSRVSAIRTVALVGPAAAGKTLLLDALLAHAGAIPQAGSIERGSTVSDHDPLEKRLGHSLQSSLAHFTHGGIRVHAIDTPGAPDFVGQALPALEAADTAIVVINAQNGVELMAQRMLGAAAERGLTRLIVVNKVDCPEVDLPGLLAQIREVFGKECLPLNLPADGATRVADCFFAASGEADFSSVAEAHRALVEQVVEVDAAFVDRYLTDGDVDPKSAGHAPPGAAWPRANRDCPSLDSAPRLARRAPGAPYASARCARGRRPPLGSRPCAPTAARSPADQTSPRENGRAAGQRSAGDPRRPDAPPATAPTAPRRL